MRLRPHGAYMPLHHLQGKEENSSTCLEVLPRISPLVGTWLCFLLKATFLAHFFFYKVEKVAFSDSKASKALALSKFSAKRSTASSTSFSIMLSPKGLVEKAKKGVPLMRSSSRSSSCSDEGTSTRVIADKGHFVAYTIDGARFMVPLAFLKTRIFQELLKISEEEFGLPGDGPITLACGAAFMEYVLLLLQRHVSGDVERALLASIDASRCSASLPSHLGEHQHHFVAFT